MGMTTGYFSFQHLGANYLYDTSSNLLVSIPATVYQYLHAAKLEQRNPLEAAFLKQLNPSENNRELVEWLDGAERHGVLLPFFPKRFSFSKKSQNALFAGLNGLVIGLTEQCNLRCKYCVYSGKHPGYRSHSTMQMQWSTLRQSIDFFLERAGRNAHITFYGGEPLLAWPLLEKAVRYVRDSPSLLSECTLHLTTNATLLDTQKIDFLVARNVAATFSIDGPQEIHDHMRVFKNGEGSYATVARNIESIEKSQASWLRQNLVINCVLHRRDKISEILRFFGNHRTYRECPVVAIGEKRRVADLTASAKESRLDKTIWNIIEEYLLAMSDKRRPFHFGLFKSLLKPVFTDFAHRDLGLTGGEDNNPCGACCPGTEKLFVDTEGSFFVCHLLDIPEARIGDCFNGFDQEKIDKLQHLITSFCIESCQRCWAYRLCTLCFAHARNGEHLNTESLTDACRREREKWKESIRMYAHIWNEEETRNLTDHPQSLHQHQKEIRQASTALPPG
jgi:uncharacterized protein